MKKRKILSVVLFTIILIVASVACFGVYGAKSDVTVVPENVMVRNTHDGVLVKWDKQGDAKGYYIYRWNGEKKEKIAAITDGNKTSFVDKDVKGGEKYFYSVSARFQKKRSLECEKVGLIRLETPEIISTENVFGGIEISWKGCAGAQSYTICRNSGRTNVILGEVSDNDACFFKDTTAISGEKYKYTVVANSLNIKSAYKYKQAQAYVVAPRLQSVVNQNGFVTLSWHGVTDAEKYVIYRKNTTGQLSYVAMVGSNVLNYQDKNVSSGEVYTYTVKAMQNGVYSGYDTAGVTAAYVGVPGNIALQNVNDCIKVSWNSVSGAFRYRIYRKDTYNTSWQLVGESINANYADNTVEDGVMYQYTVRAVGYNGGVSAYLNGRYMTALKMPKVWMNCTPDGIMVNWSKMPKATQYRVYKKTAASSSWSCIGTISDKTKTYLFDKSVQEGKSYIYTVRQVYSNVYGSYNSGVKTIFYKAPVINAKLSPNGIALNWNKAPVGNGYIIERKLQPNASWVEVSTVDGLGNLKTADSKANYGKLNYYRVRVKNANLVSNTVSIFALDPKKPAVALTYDDGPHPTVTHDILDVLEKYNAKATFFVVGSRISSYKDCIIREAQLGCEIANHTYNHTTLTSASNEKIASEIARTNNLVKSLTGKIPVLVRSPGGSINSRSAAATGCPIVHWSVDTLDWQSRNSASVIAKVKNNTRDGSIVLMHDLYGSTAKATETIVPWLISQGYQLVTVSELMQLKGIDMQPGQVYTKAY